MNITENTDPMNNTDNTNYIENNTNYIDNNIKNMNSMNITNFAFFNQFNEICILFTPDFINVIQEIHDIICDIFPDKLIFLVSVNNVICASKINKNKYESYLIIGQECPIHRFNNAVYYKQKLTAEMDEMIRSHSGSVIYDSVYSVYDGIDESYEYIGSNYYISKNNNSNLAANLPADEPTDQHNIPLIISTNQYIVDYYNFHYEEINTLPSMIIKDRMKYLMKENINGNKIKNKRIIGIIYTSEDYESMADDIICNIKNINSFNENINSSNEAVCAYKIFLRDISYERLISIDHLDCPVFQCDIPIHIPVISPFSVSCAVENKWISTYVKNYITTINRTNTNSSICTGNTALTTTIAGELMELRDFKGVSFMADNEVMGIFEGRSGLASKYENEK